MGCPTSRCVQRGFNGNVLRGCPTLRCVQRGFNGNVLRGYPTSGCIQGGSMVIYKEVCPEGVQNKCPGGVWCRGFMSWWDTLILAISMGVQLYYGIAHIILRVRRIFR